MKSHKYYVLVTTDNEVYGYGSNSRNARRHLLENEAAIVRIFKNGSNDVICSACRLMDCILVGTPPKK